MRYIVVQRTSFVPYFLSEWSDTMDRWDCVRARALVFDGPAARRVVNQLNARSPLAALPVSIEAAFR
jgi:hypothetical protein